MHHPLTRGTRTSPGSSVDAAGGGPLSRACLPTDAYEAENEEELEAAPEA